MSNADVIIRYQSNLVLENSFVFIKIINMTIILVVIIYIIEKR